MLSFQDSWQFFENFNLQDDEFFFLLSHILAHDLFFRNKFS